MLTLAAMLATIAVTSIATLATPAGEADAAMTLAMRSRQRTYQSPDRAVEALVGAIRAGDSASLRRILGPGSAGLVESGDAVADRASRMRFLQSYDAAHRIDRKATDSAVLIVGTEEWPLPIPIVRGRYGWRFDAAAGEREILDRRIGRNELAVIEVCREYVKAQREYANIQARSAGAASSAPEYARHILSREGKRDGLYWPPAAGEPESPFGPLIAAARAEGYQAGAPQGRSQPYHGYYFRILTAQGASAPGGARSYLVDGRMTGGFGLLAFPANYGNSGVMTFIVDQDGIVFQRDLGPATGAVARRITAYDPDANWRAP